MTSEFVRPRSGFDAECDRRALAAAARRGDLRRPRRGLYLPADAWERMPEREQAQVAIRAVAAVSRTQPVFSHWSAAVLLGLPYPRAEVGRVHRTVPGGSRPNQPGLVTHLAPLDPADVVEIGGLLCTSAERTAVDIGAAVSFEDGVMVADAVLRRDRRNAEQGRAAMEAALRRAGPRRSARRIEAVVAFADPLSESPGESRSRVTMHRLRLPAPVLQHRFVDAAGFVARADFWFPHVHAVGECDGAAKYLDPALNGGDPARVMVDEKRREDRLRALDERVARWGWREAVSAALLGPVLARVGVVPVE